MSVNKAILVGNVGNEPEVRHLDAGTAVANFSIATSESYKNKDGERVTQTEWHNIVAWRGLAEVVEKYVHKGQQVYIEGRIRTRVWDDKDGNKRYTTEIVADSLQMLGKKNDSDSDSVAAPASSFQNKTEATNTGTASEPEPEDDLPF